MAEEFDPSKTEDATPRRLEKAREEGQIAFSPDLNSAAALFVAAIAAVWILPSIGRQMQEQLKTRIVTLSGTEWNIASTEIAVQWLFHEVWVIAGGISLVFLMLTLGLSKIQTGFLITMKPLDPQFNRMNPVSGLKRLFSLESTVRGLLSLFRLGSHGFVAVMIMWMWGGSIVMGTQGRLSTSVSVGWQLCVQMLLALSLVALVWGATDYGFRRFRQKQRLKMTLQEIKEEAREESGDPHLKARLRRLQREAAQRKSLADVPKASVVLTNPTHYAIAILYEPGKMAAPKILAKGSGAFARRIAETARKNGVVVLERKPLTRALYAITNVGDEIPVEFYRAIAEILAYLQRLKRSG